ncbi:TetR/AcrR family transcriptional regulator [Nocardia carnea]|uniref:TetR/AcrR family transcriptional regulator n=1 Tax=Nocardia carnea TaxID=37328 RepID=A0ABW7TWV0_9NOCA|nr:TetR/AcrR family transcriptional regulator [Nocardia carnea]
MAAPYRRSNLRDVLLDRAMTVLQDRGAGALSLRELARDVGVSHTAPARHFADRHQLLEAVAVEGFRKLATEIRNAIAAANEPSVQAYLAAQAYITFTIEKANLVDVMFRHEAGRGDAIGQSAAAAFEPLLHLFQGAETRGTEGADAATTATLFLATLQGITALVNCGVVPPDAASGLIDNAVPRFIQPIDQDTRGVGPRTAS